MLRPALAFSALAIAGSSAGAASYSATLSAPASGRIIARDIVWNCGRAACQGSTEESRPLVLCQALAKRAGPIDGFIVDGRAFSAADLERCNASAKPQPPSTIASQ